jgi:hypothetical protein
MMYEETVTFGTQTAKHHMKTKITVTHTTTQRKRGTAKSNRCRDISFAVISLLLYSDERDRNQLQAHTFSQGAE